MSATAAVAGKPIHTRPSLRDRRSKGVPKAFRGGQKVLVACEERSIRFEIGNARKKGDYSLTFEFSPVR